MSLWPIDVFFSHQSAWPMPMIPQNMPGQPRHPASLDVHPRHRRDQVLRRVGGHFGGVQGTRPNSSGNLQGKGGRGRSSWGAYIFGGVLGCSASCRGKFLLREKSGIALGRGFHPEVDRACPFRCDRAFARTSERLISEFSAGTLAASPLSSSPLLRRLAVCDEAEMFRANERCFTAANIRAPRIK